MANKILVTHQQLQTSSTKFKNTASQLQTLIKQLDSELNNLKSGWDGMAQDRFYETWNTTNKKTFEAVVKDCEALSQKLTTVSNKMKELDSQLAGQMAK